MKSSVSLHLDSRILICSHLRKDINRECQGWWTNSIQEGKKKKIISKIKERIKKKKILRRMMITLLVINTLIINRYQLNSRLFNKKNNNKKCSHLNKISWRSNITSSSKININLTKCSTRSKRIWIKHAKIFTINKFKWSNNLKNRRRITIHKINTHNKMKKQIQNLMKKVKLTQTQIKMKR